MSWFGCLSRVAKMTLFGNIRKSSMAQEDFKYAIDKYLEEHPEIIMSPKEFSELYKAYVTYKIDLDPEDFEKFLK